MEQRQLRGLPRTVDAFDDEETTGNAMLAKTLHAGMPSTKAGILSRGIVTPV
jgi:hypothetical protein